MIAGRCGDVIRRCQRVWNVMPCLCLRQLNSLSLRIKHVIQLLVNFLERVIEIVFLFLRVFNVRHCWILENTLRLLIL